METQKNNGMCRCCASEGTFKDVKSSYQWMGEEEIYADMLRECLDISLCADVSGEVEGGICEVCITQLRNASNFKKQVLHTEEQFKQRIQDKLFKNEIVKVELSPQHEEDSDNDNVLDSTLDDDYSGTEYEVPVKTEVEEKPKKRGKAAKASTSRAKKLKKEDGESSKRNQRKPELQEVIIKIEPVEHTENNTVENEPDFSETVHKQTESDNKTETETGEEKKTSQFTYWRSSMWHILDNSNATVISHYTGSGYKCCFCPTEFLTPAQLKQHNIETHPKDIKKYKKFVEKAKFFANLDITDLRCKICKVDIPNVEQLIDHLTNEHKKKVAPTVKNVIFPYKFISDELRCCDCSKLFRTFKTLQEHMHSHYSNYICHVCSAGFVNKRSFDVHMVKHSAKPKFETDHAQPERKTDLMPEKNKLRNICRFCNERFADHRNKLKHMLDVHNVGVSSYKCQLCERVFGSIRGVTDHTKNFHLNMRPHKCELCEMTFYKIYQLKNHMLKHTQIKAHVCEICHKKYARKCTLIEHMRIHTDDRRHVCRVCGLAFIQTSKLKSHMRSSHGEDSI